MILKYISLHSQIAGVASSFPSRSVANMLTFTHLEAQPASVLRRVRLIAALVRHLPPVHQRVLARTEIAFEQITPEGQVPLSACWLSGAKFARSEFGLELKSWSLVAWKLFGSKYVPPAF